MLLSEMIKHTNEITININTGSAAHRMATDSTNKLQLAILFIRGD